MKIKRFQGGYDNNFCYVLSCNETRTAAIVDPSVEIDPVNEYIHTNDLILDKILITHTHYDHIHYLDDFINLYSQVKVYASSNAKLSNSINFHKLEHNDVIGLGKHLILSLFTPGHHFDSICYWVKSKDIIFTGDTMFVGRTGRTISSGSDIKKLYNSTYNILLKLPLETIIYPGHHYGFSKVISLRNNIKHSVFFKCKNFSEFDLVMKNFEKTRNS